jgi:hypothetical protein
MDIGLPFRLDHVDYYSDLSVPSTGEDIQIKMQSSTIFAYTLPYFPLPSAVE